jgi:hypothetical protein
MRRLAEMMTLPSVFAPDIQLENGTRLHQEFLQLADHGHLVLHWPSCSNLNFPSIRSDSVSNNSSCRSHYLTSPKSYLRTVHSQVRENPIFCSDVEANRDLARSFCVTAIRLQNENELVPRIVNASWHRVKFHRRFQANRFDNCEAIAM